MNFDPDRPKDARPRGEPPTGPFMRALQRPFVAVAQRFERSVPVYETVEDATPPASVVGFMWHYIRQARWPFAALLVLGGMVALVEAALFYFTGRIVDVLATADRAAGWDGLLAGHGPELTFMLVIVAVGRTIAVAGSALIEEQVIVPGFFNRVRWQANAHVSRQSIGFFEDRLSGMVATRVWQSGQAVGDLMNTTLQVVWFFLVYAVTTLALVGDLDWRLAAIVGVWLVLFAVVARWFLPRVRARARRNAEVGSETNGRIVDSYANMMTVRLFGSREADDRYMRRTFDRWIGTITAFTRMLTGVRVCLTALSGLAIAAVGMVAVDLWLAGTISAGAVAFTLALVLRLSMLLGRLMMQLNGVLRTVGTIQNSADIVSKPLEIVDAPDASDLVTEGCAIRFEGVHFRYRSRSDERPLVIDGVTLDVAPGERVGLVGRSGAGKSTLVNLLLRFYEVEKGRILIDGQDVSRVTQDSLRAAIGMITQDTSLLHRSVRDNVAYARPDATDEEVREALRRAEALEFVEDIEDRAGRRGLDAFVGERGVKLSGGQRQRIAIARVMLKDAPILVLDEATSALDSEVEAAIQQNLDELMGGKTVIAIAHRLSTIASLDRLVVLDGGRIVESGTHDGLLSQGGLYARLWARQSGGFLPLDEAAE